MTDPHPWPGGLDITDSNAAQVAAARPPVMRPQLWRALAQELSRCQAGGEWTSSYRYSGSCGHRSNYATLMG